MQGLQISIINDSINIIGSKVQMSNDDSSCSQYGLSMGLTFEATSLAQYKPSIEAVLKEEKLGDLVLKFSNKNGCKRNQRKLHNFSYTTCNFQDHENSESLGYAKSAKQRSWGCELTSREGRRTVPVSGTPKQFSELSPSQQRSNVGVEKDRKVCLRPNFREKTSDHSTLEQTNRYEIRDHSQYHTQKSDNFGRCNEPKTACGSYSGFLKVVDIEESFEISGIDEYHLLEGSIGKADSARVILEESTINPVCEQLKNKLDFFLNIQGIELQPPNRKDQPQAQQKRMRTIRTLQDPESQKKERKLVRDSRSNLLFEQNILRDYFSSDKKKDDTMWYYLLGSHPALRNLLGVEKSGNDLAVYWEPFPEQPQTLKNLLEAQKLKRIAIPDIVRQILNVIYHFRKFNVLHGYLLPENFHCFPCTNEGYYIKLKCLKDCSRFTSKQAINSKMSRKNSYYSPYYERNSFLVPDLIALCLMTLELYTGIEPSVEQVLSNLEKNYIPQSWSQLPAKAYDFMKTILGLVKNNHESQSLECVLIHEFMWASGADNYFEQM